MKKGRIGLFIKENILFLILIVIALTFAVSPIILGCPLFAEKVSEFMQPLKNEGYKSAYIEMLGSILGTFLAISGALMTQRSDEKKREAQIIKETATIIYYDFKFAFEEIISFESAYACIKPGINNQYDDLKYFLKFRKSNKIYIDSNWITNVAKLCNVLSADEIRQIYKIYGACETIKEAFDKDEQFVNERTAHKIFHLIHQQLCDLVCAPNIEINITKTNEKIIRKLEMIANLEQKKD